MDTLRLWVNAHTELYMTGVLLFLAIPVVAAMLIAMIGGWLDAQNGGAK